MQRFFTAFPHGWPGAGLLLLRSAIGLLVLAQGGLYLTSPAGSPTAEWIAGTLGLTAGGALLLGLLTPVAAPLAGLWALGIGFSFLPAPASNLFDSKPAVVLIAIVSLATAFLGPGAISLDAWLFGRREIIIPRRSER